MCLLLVVTLRPHRCSLGIQVKDASIKAKDLRVRFEVGGSTPTSTSSVAIEVQQSQPSATVSAYGGRMTA